jgi:hypothetical protein
MPTNTVKTILIIITTITITTTATAERVAPDANVYSMDSVVLFVCWSVLISDCSSGIFAKVFRGLTRSLQANAWIASQLGQDRFPPDLFQFI